MGHHSIPQFTPWRSVMNAHLSWDFRGAQTSEDGQRPISSNTSRAYPMQVAPEVLRAQRKETRPAYIWITDCLSERETHQIHNFMLWRLRWRKSSVGTSDLT